MVKFKMFYDSDKETEWLNRMAEQGWAMTGFFFGFYRFAKCEPGEYIYQVDITEKMFSLSEDYQQFMKEMGVEVVCLWGPWVILRRRAEDGSFKMYTDVESTITHYTKVRKWFSVAGMVEFACLIEGIYCAMLQKQGQVMGWVIVFAAAVIMLLLMREVVRLNGILTELNGRLGRKISEPGGTFSALVSGLRMGGVGIGLLCAVILYPMMVGLLHELGHCIVVWIYGGTVTGFHPFSPNPYMTYEGFGLPSALIDIGGSVLPLVAAAAVLLFYRGSKKHSWLNICLGIISSITLLTVVPWIVQPVCYLFGLADQTEDIIKFINNTGFHPVAVTLCSIIVFALMCLLLVKKIPKLFGCGSGPTRKAAGTKFMISIASLMIALGIVIQVLGLLSPASADEVLAEGNFQYTAESSRDSMLQEKFDIEIQKPGEYAVHVEWETDSEGIVAAVVLRDEDEVYFYCTGSIYLSVDSHLMHLDRSSYDFSFYILRCEEDWLEFCRIAGADANDLADVSWQPDAPPTATGSYRLVQKK